MQMRPTSLRGFRAVIVCAGLLALPVTTLAQVVTAPPTPQIGSSNTVSADPAVKRPHGKPCRVQRWHHLCQRPARVLPGELPGNSFRETEVTVDGRPAGVAPVYPWIYTGGIDPFLWEPIPGVQTLNFQPYRVDLTPFAGVLSDGKVHTLQVAR